MLDSVDIAYREIEKANQYRNSKIEEAQKYTNTVVPTAEAEAIQLIEEAKAHRARVIAQAKADVAEFTALYAEYVKNPEIIREKIYTESMQDFIENNNIIIDTTSDNSLYKFYNMDDNNASGRQSSGNVNTQANTAGVTQNIVEQQSDVEGESVEEGVEDNE